MLKRTEAAIVIFLALTMLVTACNKGNNEQQTNAGPAAVPAASPEDVSDMEKIAWLFIDAISVLYELGVEYDGMGLDIAAKSMYGTTAASVSAMRYAVDCLLYLKGEGGTLEDVTGSRLCDWDEIAALGYASPYPYLFEGVTLQADGRDGEATGCFEMALRNPNLPEGSDGLLCIAGLDIEALLRLKTKLTGMEDELLPLFSPAPESVPRNQYNYSSLYLRNQARTALETQDDFAGATDYYLTALSVDPFESYNYAGLVVMYIFMEDSDSAIYYLNEGLFVDPDDEGLNKLLESMRGVMGQ